MKSAQHVSECGNILWSKLDPKQKLAGLGNRLDLDRPQTSTSPLLVRLLSLGNGSNQVVAKVRQSSPQL